MKSSPVPANSQAKVNLMGLDRRALENFFTGLGEKPFRARQVLKWIHDRGVVDFGAMTDLSKALRERLSQLAEIPVLNEVRSQQSTDGTRKWLLELTDGNRIETVFIPEARRGTLCVSSQVGCALNCAFCATARQGFSRNLTAGEIVAQVWHARQMLGEGHISNVVLMGMGEPLLNFDAVVSALDLMMDDLAYGFAKRRVTVSTAGLVPAILRLGQESDASLAVSLHATTDSLRDELVPINRKYPLTQLMEACYEFIHLERQKGRKITWEYVMLDGINDSPEDARRLVKLLSKMPSKINLIPFNRFEGAPYRCTPPERIARFQAILQAAGFLTTVRKTRGEDIDAACGQLVGKVQAKSRPRREFKLEAEVL
ncbi:MAG: bifunctional tRNA (adenosine(37)-C2)-methyltransferase TrmG/ribosomal RNA large subunit methyltransferase RlmN [Methylothermaceae bacteria B42]|nr:MAG: bifunctional tRNA (adenosine(37)-C2)-methyltransferase TrmG/ribosomal RNA large subunit methyltransferase RlmN [Methylothermaceae bacteria B42]HHJ38460.1 23S rRNA (adenine(2503)-C(2))-methyltransferase RlmN [Methylothermaceae bacterium]